MYEFLEDLDSMKSGSNYLKLSKLKEGESKFRVMVDPIAGWLDWQDNKPFRYRAKDRPTHSFDPDKPMKKFIALYVWDYERRDLFVLEVTQGSIIKSIEKLARDADWGDLTAYDIKINKTGSSLDTRYEVTSVPHKAAPEDALKRLQEAPVRLSALFEGKDPWKDLEIDSEAFKVGSWRSKELAQRLIDEIPDLPATDVDGLAAYLELFGSRNPNKSLSAAVDDWILHPEIFRTAYKTYLKKDSIAKIAAA